VCQAPGFVEAEFHVSRGDEALGLHALGLVLDGWHEAELAVQASVVVLVAVFGDGERTVHCSTGWLGKLTIHLRVSGHFATSDSLGLFDGVVKGAAVDLGHGDRQVQVSPPPLAVVLLR